MKSGKNEFLSLVCNLYLIALLAVLPLYTGEGYWMLGDTKYTLFRNVSIFCLGCWLVLGMPGRFRAVREWLGTPDGRLKIGILGCRLGKGMPGGNRGKNVPVFSEVDRAVAAYGVCVVLSALCSSYGKLAWTGYDGWYMGAFSQLIFVGIYFFVSRQYGGALYPLYLGEAAFFLTAVFGLLHKLGIDPLGLQAGWNSGDWEYSHMLSTLGNINWLCGYYSVALAFLLAHYLLEERCWLQAVLYVAALAAMILLGIQGSQGGLLILGVGAGMCLLLGRKRKVVLQKLFLLLAGFFIGMPVMELLMRLRGKMAAVVRDGNVFDHAGWYVWSIGAAVCLAFFFAARYRDSAPGAGPSAGDIHGRRQGGQSLAGRIRSMRESGAGSREPGASCRQESGAGSREPGASCRQESGAGSREPGASDKREAGTGSREPGASDKREAGAGGRARRPGWLAVLCPCVVLAVIVLACRLTLRWGGDGFGSGRGFLWRIALEGFGQSGVKDKLLGAGPDCYAEAVFNTLGAGTEVWKGEHWEGAVFTNAHNEVLSQLINVGLLGTVCCLAIYVAGLFRYGGIGHGWNGYGRDSIRCGENESGRGRDDRGQKERWLGLLVIAMYGIHSLISFQQVLNTPLLFLALGLCEHGMRSGFSGDAERGGEDAALEPEGDEPEEEPKRYKPEGNTAKQSEEISGKESRMPVDGIPGGMTRQQGD